MKSFKMQQVATIAMTIAASFLVTSCTSTKVSQCADMIKVINQTVVDTKETTKSGTTLDVQIVEKLVDVFARAAKDMSSVNTDDEKLKTYKSQFLSMYQGGTEINKQLIVSLKERKSTKVHEELKKSNNIFSPERDLATGLTQYCQTPEK
jgi:methionine-rich copper-binding protein CopC